MSDLATAVSASARSKRFHATLGVLARGERSGRAADPDHTDQPQYVGRLPAGPLKSMPFPQASASSTAWFRPFRGRFLGRLRSATLTSVEN